MSSKFIFLLLLVTVDFIESARILAVFPSFIKSHSLFTHPIAKELAKRGHDVTIITPFEETEPLPNYKQIIADKKSCWDIEHAPEDVEAFVQGGMPFLLQEIDRWNSLIWFTETGFNSTAVKDFILNDKSRFDLVITEVFYQEAFLMFAHKYKAPVVMLSSFGASHFINEFMGNPLTLSTTPFEFIDFFGPLTLWQRIKNAVCTFVDITGRWLYHLPVQQSLAEMHFGHLPKPLPRLSDLERNVSLILVNTHFSIDTVRPSVPGVVEVGGIHIKQPKEIPKVLQKILDQAKDGIIYFSLGSIIKGSAMPKWRIDQIVKVFSNLKQTVLWKWENDDPPEARENVIFSKWLPQTEILSHPNTKMFITHGGLLGIQESIYYGVPVIGMPFYGDQFLNVDRAVKGGYGVQLLFRDVSEASVGKAIKEILNNPSYSQKAKEISKRFKDKPESPLETAMFWIEYVIRNKGADYMKSPILNLYWYENMLLDVAAIIIFGSTLVGVVVYFLVSILCKLLWFRKPSKRKNKYVKNE